LAGVEAVRYKDLFWRSWWRSVVIRKNAGRIFEKIKIRLEDAGIGYF